MLELKNIKKTYITAQEKVEALKGINIKFRESEFVSILGQSGCGKTTLLNIIGGLDRYTSGDLIINGKSTKNFKDRDWDAYRNYKIGFVFQSYNLIGHQTVLSNVELALTIGGISKGERKKRAIKALEEVGLKDHIHKKPNQLSGGQMQRVAIARALVNNPDIILADEPTGALDTKTSVQVMEILKKISKDKLIIMVTHNPELAEKYSSRIIKILDGNITEDSNPIRKDEEIIDGEDKSSIGRTSMKFWTAFRLSLNNLLTKKGRTILVAFAGSIGIIGIALVQSVSNGFQAYVDSIQEDTLTSYPLTIMQETTDLAGTLLSMRTENSEENDDGKIKEEQYVSKLLANLSTNDLKSFNEYFESNYKNKKDDIYSVKYGYSVKPNIYSMNNEGKISKLSPQNFMNSSYGMSMFSSYTSVYSQMIDNTDNLDESYDILKGRFPEKYDELLIVLSDKDSISDLLVYSLGFRDMEELTSVITKIMNGENVELENEPLELTYDDLMNVELKLIIPSDVYKYNEEYDIYEDMTRDEEYMTDLYNNAIKLKVVGIVSAKEGVTSSALNPGVSYTSDLVDYIINYSSNTDIVKKQIENQDVDVLSGSRFDEKNNDLDLDFSDLISIDTNMLKSAFNINLDVGSFETKAEDYMKDLLGSIDTDTTEAKEDFSKDLDKLAHGLIRNLPENVDSSDTNKIVDNYLEGYEPSKIFTELEEKYLIPKETFKATYASLLKGLLPIYIRVDNIVTELNKNIDDIEEKITTNVDEIINSLPEEVQEEIAKLPESFISKIIRNIKEINVEDAVISTYTNSALIDQTASTMSNVMKEASMKKDIMTKLGELVTDLSDELASAFNVDQSKIANSFKMNMTEDEITRIITAMLTKKETNAKTNLANFGYQDKEEPTYIAFYFNSFDGKERFIDFLDSYNEEKKNLGEDDKVINYTDTTGILMDSVKIIVNAVTYVLIAFISISLVVSSIMIGIITYISVYERTKEIGILRAIGASKHNISSIFNAETFIIGLLSGLFGIGITYSVIPIINGILHAFTGNIPLNATFYFQNALSLVILSVVLTLIGGIIPARAASKKDPVIALRTE